MNNFLRRYKLTKLAQDIKSNLQEIIPLLYKLYQSIEKKLSFPTHLIQLATPLNQNWTRRAHIPKKVRGHPLVGADI